MLLQLGFVAQARMRHAQQSTCPIARYAALARVLHLQHASGHAISFVTSTYKSRSERRLFRRAFRQTREPLSIRRFHAAELRRSSTTTKPASSDCLRAKSLIANTSTSAAAHGYHTSFDKRHTLDPAFRYRFGASQSRDVPPRYA